MNGNHKESYFSVFTEVRLLSLAIISIDFIHMSVCKVAENKSKAPEIITRRFKNGGMCYYY